MNVSSQIRRSLPVFLLTTLFLLLATAAVAADTPVNPEGEPVNNTQFFVSTIWFFALGMIGYFFLVTRPALQKEEAQKKFLSELKRGDEVVTTGGLIGRVQTTGQDTTFIEIATNVRVRVKTDHLSPYEKSTQSAVTEGDAKRVSAEGA